MKASRRLAGSCVMLAVEMSAIFVTSGTRNALLKLIAIDYMLL